MHELLKKYLLNGITYSPGGEGGGDDDGGDDGGTNDSGTNDGPKFGETADDEDALDPELKSVFDAYKKDGEDDDSAELDDTIVDDEDADKPIPPETVTAMDTRIKSTISRMKITDDAIPADFDPSDRTQLKALLDKTVQQTVAQVMGVVFDPVKLALNHAMSENNRRMDLKIARAGDGMRATNIIETQVPEILDGQYSPMLKAMDSVLKSKGKKPAERAETLRKTLNQMGVKKGDHVSSGRRGSNNNGVGAKVSTGKKALDSFFGPISKVALK